MTEEQFHDALSFLMVAMWFVPLGTVVGLALFDIARHAIRIRKARRASTVTAEKLLAEARVYAAQLPQDVQ